jgi:hypothetical protein
MVLQSERHEARHQINRTLVMTAELCDYSSKSFCAEIAGKE